MPRALFFPIIPQSRFPVNPPLSMRVPLVRFLIEVRQTVVNQDFMGVAVP